MRLKIRTNNTVVSILAENIVLRTQDRGKIFIEASCANMDVYRFTYGASSQKEKKKFIEACERVIDAIDGKRESFYCSLTDFQDVKFEKVSFGSHID